MKDRFPHGAARFLSALRRNNRKDWFDEHRSDYEDEVLQPAKEFVIDLGAKLRILRPKLQIDPRINYGVKRINRDVRFARDKKPYKDHQTLWWWEGRTKEGSPGYWFNLTPKSVVLAVGLYMAQPGLLDRYHEAVASWWGARPHRQGHRAEGLQARRLGAQACAARFRC